MFLVDNEVIPDETMNWLRVYILFETQKYKCVRKAP